MPTTAGRDVSQFLAKTLQSNECSAGEPYSRDWAGAKWAALACWSWIRSGLPVSQFRQANPTAMTVPQRRISVAIALARGLDCIERPLGGCLGDRPFHCFARGMNVSGPRGQQAGQEKNEFLAALTDCMVARKSNSRRFEDS